MGKQKHDIGHQKHLRRKAEHDRIKEAKLAERLERYGWKKKK